MDAQVTQRAELQKIERLTIKTESGRVYELEETDGFLVIRSDTPLFGQWRDDGDLVVGQVNPAEVLKEGWTQCDPKIRSML
jgi:hypothetical protein